MTRAELDALAATIGADGAHLLTTIYGPTAPGWLREVPAVQTLRCMWLQNYHAPDASTGLMRLRAAADMPPGALLLQSPYDLDARFSTKRETSWIGYRLHLTETCDEGTPDLITQVATVPATTNDVEMTDVIQADLATRDLLPGEHLLDAGYVSARHLVTSEKTHGITLVGPALLDTSWQATTDQGFDVTHFAIDWERRVVTCPGGKTSRSWTDTAKGAYPFHQIGFDKADCAACPLRPRCTRSATNPRQLSLRPREEHATLQAARQRQTTAPFATLYRKRAGVEGTMAQAAQGCGERRARYRTLPKVRLEHVALATAISLQRLDDWWTETRRATTRTSRFAALDVA
jgi:hypothetical protein